MLALSVAKLSCDDVVSLSGLNAIQRLFFWEGGGALTLAARINPLLHKPSDWSNFSG